MSTTAVVKKMEVSCHLLKEEYMLKKGRDLPADTAFVQYGYTNQEGCEFRVDLTVADFLKDWFGECEHCPENDAEVFDVKIGTIIGAVSVSFAFNERIVFEDLAETLSKNFS